MQVARFLTGASAPFKFIHTYTHTNIHTYIYIHTYIHIHTYMQVARFLTGASIPYKFHYLDGLKYKKMGDVKY